MKLLDSRRLTGPNHLASQAGAVIDVSFGDTDFLVAWHRRRTGLDDGDVYGARVTPQGTVLDPAGFVVSQEARLPLQS